MPKQRSLLLNINKIKFHTELYMQLQNFDPQINIGIVKVYL